MKYFAQLWYTPKFMKIWHRFPSLKKKKKIWKHWYLELKKKRKPAKDFQLAGPPAHNVKYILLRIPGRNPQHPARAAPVKQNGAGVKHRRLEKTVVKRAPLTKAYHLINVGASSLNIKIVETRIIYNSQSNVWIFVKIVRYKMTEWRSVANPCEYSTHVSVTVLLRRKFINDPSQLTVPTHVQ